MDYFFYSAGTMAAFIPVLVRIKLKPLYLAGWLILSFLSVIQLYRKLDEKKRKLLFYLPLLFVFASFVKGRRPRIGLVLTMVAMFCLGILLVDSIILKNKLFKEENDKTLFKIQILLLMAASMYMLTSSIRLANLEHNVTIQ